MSTYADFLKKPFEVFQCIRCHKLFQRMTIDKEMKTCPKCSNGTESEDE